MSRFSARSFVLLFILFALLSMPVYAQSSDKGCQSLFQSGELTERPHMMQPIPADSPEFQRLLELVKEENPHLGPGFDLVYPGALLKVPNGSYISARLQRYLRGQLEDAKVSSCSSLASGSVTDTTIVITRQGVGSSLLSSRFWLLVLVILAVVAVVGIVAIAMVIAGNQNGDAGSRSVAFSGNSSDRENEGNHDTQADNDRNNSDGYKNNDSSDNEADDSAANCGDQKDDSRRNNENNRAAEEPHRAVGEGSEVTVHVYGDENEVNVSCGEKSKSYSAKERHREEWKRDLSEEEEHDDEE